MTNTSPTNVPHKDSIIKIILAFYPHAKIYLFGSYASGKNRSSSDIDVAIDTGSRLSLRDWSFLWNLLDALPTAQKIDLVDMHDIPDDLRQTILTKGIPWKD